MRRASGRRLILLCALVIALWGCGGFTPQPLPVADERVQLGHHARTRQRSDKGREDPAVPQKAEELALTLEFPALGSRRAER